LRVVVESEAPNTGIEVDERGQRWQKLVIHSGCRAKVLIGTGQSKIIDFSANERHAPVFYVAEPEGSNKLLKFE
jgi:hypothetical protein